MARTPASTQLLNRVTQQLKQVSSDSKTPAGEAQAHEPSVEQKEAIAAHAKDQEDTKKARDTHLRRENNKHV